jgi:hypothetical protein
MAGFEVTTNGRFWVTAEELGKHRPRVDIEFVLLGRGRRPRCHVEAKRLCRAGSINEYFGADGLGMFVAGTYASGETYAGMLGYVQTENSQIWLSRLTSGFVSRATQLCACETFRSAPDYQDIAAVHMSGHQRTSGRIDVYHLLLEFL